MTALCPLTNLFRPDTHLLRVFYFMVKLLLGRYSFQLLYRRVREPWDAFGHLKVMGWTGNRRNLFLKQLKTLLSNCCFTAAWQNDAKEEACTSFSALFNNLLCGFLTVSRATRNRNIFSVNRSFPELSISEWYA